MLMEALLVGIILGWYRKGSLVNLTHVKMRGIALIIVSFLLKFVLDTAAAHGLQSITAWTMPVHLFSYLLVFLFLILNWRLPGMRLFALGSLLNFVVVSLNQGTMPVNIAGLSNDLVAVLQNGLNATHSIADAKTRLALLGDSIFLPYPSPRRISPGDVFLMLGLVVFIVKAMTARYMYKLNNTRSFSSSLKIRRKSAKIN